MYKIKNSDIPFLTISKENIFTICNSLENDEIGIIIKAFMDYVYFGIEPTFEKKHLNGIFMGVLQTMERKSKSYFSRAEHMNKVNNEKKVKKAENSPNGPDLTINDTEVPQGGENVSEAPKQGEFDNSIEEFETDTNNDTPINTNDDMGMLIGTLKGYREVSVEARSEQPKFDASKFINWLKENNQCLYTKVIRTPSKSLSTNDNMRRMKESLDGQLRDYIKDETKRQQLYLYVIENQ